MSCQEFEARFPDEEACARFLVKRRWPNGFVCPAAGGIGVGSDAPAADLRRREMLD